MEDENHAFTLELLFSIIFIFTLLKFHIHHLLHPSTSARHHPNTSPSQLHVLLLITY